MKVFQGVSEVFLTALLGLAQYQYMKGGGKYRLQQCSDSAIIALPSPALALSRQVSMSQLLELKKQSTPLADIIPIISIPAW